MDYAELYILDQNFNATFYIDIYSSFIWTERYCDCGDFELVLPATHDAFNKFVTNNYIYWPESDRLMIIEHLSLKTDVTEGNELKVTGRSIESFLYRRVIKEEMIFEEGTNFQTIIHDILDATFMNPTYVDGQSVVHEDTPRKVSNFIFEYSTDPVITSLTSGCDIAIGDNVFDLIQTFCSSLNLGFKIVPDIYLKRFIFSLYSGADRSYNASDNYVVLSPEYESLLNSNLEISIEDYKNHAVIEGDYYVRGDEIIVEDLNVEGATGLNRREVYVDATDMTLDENAGEEELAVYKYLLRQRGLDELVVDKTQTLFDGEMNADSQFIYNIDFFVGDIVQIENEYGLQTVSRVTEYIRSFDNNGKRYYPTLSAVS